MEVTRRRCHVEAGRIQSCGCLRVPHGDTSVTASVGMSATYHAWIRLRHAQTAAVDAAWVRSYRAFRADVGARPSRGHVLRRADVDLPWGPGNAIWVEASRSAFERRAKVRRECRFILEIARELGIADNYEG